MTDRKYTLEDFADLVDINHPLAARRIPVIRYIPVHWKYHIALVIGGPDWMPIKGLEPEDWEVDQLLVFLEKTMRYYTKRYRRMVEERAPFDIDDTVNTHIFRKTYEYGWQYSKYTWEDSQYWPSPYSEKRLGPFTLEQLLDLIQTVGGGTPNKDWLDLKAESGKFGPPPEPDLELASDPLPSVDELAKEPRPFIACKGCSYQIMANKYGLADALRHDLSDECHKRNDANADGWRLVRRTQPEGADNEGGSDAGEHHQVPPGGAHEEQR